MRRLGVAVVLVALSALALGQDGLPPSLGVVLDLERPSETDVLLLRNGDQLTGTILNESFNIRTSYAQLSFNNRVVAGIDLEGGASNIESIITVNDNRFSGFIDDPVFAFRLQSGPVIEIRREKVLKAVFRLREQELEGIPQRQFVTMKNGDRFSGLLLNTNLVAATTYADVPLDLASVESITFIGEANPLTRVLFHNGDALQGILNQEDMRFILDVGGEVEVYQDRIDSVFLREGFVPRAAAASAANPAAAPPSGGPGTPRAGPVGAVRVPVYGSDFRDERLQRALAHAVDWASVSPGAVLEFPESGTRSDASLRYDPERARELLAEAGWPNSFAMVLRTTAEVSQGSPEALQRLVAYLRDVGIDVSQVIQERASLDLIEAAGGTGVVDNVVRDRLIMVVPR